MMSIIYTCLCMLALISAAEAAAVVTAIDAANSAFNLIGHFPTHRACTVRIKNMCTSHSLSNPDMYIRSGSSSVALPHDIGPNQESTVQFVKTSHVAKGAVGVFTYDLKIHDSGPYRRERTLILMYSVPYDFSFHSSWYAVGLWYDAIPANYDLYYKMYYENWNLFTRRAADQYIFYEENRYTIKASMTNTFTPTIVVEIFDDYRR